METPKNIKVYQSPILVLEALGFHPDTFSEIDIKNALEKIPHENISIVIGNLSKTSTDIIETLQNTNESNWEYHSIIYSYKGLLHFLQNNMFERSEMEQAYKFRYKPGFVQFASPFFARSFQVVAADLIKNKNLHSLKDLISYSGFINTSHEEVAFEPILNYLQPFIDEIRQLAASEIFPDEEQTQRLLSEGLVSVFNGLPSFAEHLREEYLDLFLSVFRKVQKKVSAETWNDAWLMLKKIHGSKAQEEQKEELEKEKPQKAKPKKFLPSLTENTLLWSIGVFCVLGILLIISLLHKKDAEPLEQEEIISGSFGGREAGDYASFEDQLSSSTNENNFKNYLIALCKIKLPGRQRTIKTGISPFDDVSVLPQTQGNSTITVSNNSQKDAILLYFTSNNVLINPQSRLYAVLIRRNEEYSFSFDANYGRLNFAFGTNWMELKDPLAFPLYDKSEHNSGEEGAENISGYWNVKDFFSYPDPATFYLQHYLTIQNFVQTGETSNMAPVSKLLNEPLKSELYSKEPKHVNLVLSGRNVKVTAKGNLYVYQSP